MGSEMCIRDSDEAAYFLLCTVKAEVAFTVRNSKDLLLIGSGMHSQYSPSGWIEYSKPSSASYGRRGLTGSGSWAIRSSLGFRGCHLMLACEA